MPVNSARRDVKINSMKSFIRKSEYLKFIIPKFLQFSILPIDKEKRGAESGFSLVEVVIAMLVFLVAMLGIFVTFVYAINYNSGNNSRAQALAVLQKEVENIRSAKYTPTVLDPTLAGGVKAQKTVTSANLNTFVVQITVDDDPFTPGVQIDTTQTIKEISVTVKLDRPTPGWQTSIPATVVLRRSRSN